MIRCRSLLGRLRLVLAAALLPLAAAQGQVPAGPLPLKYAGPATTTAITAGDLMTRLYLFADDSMMGRAIGTPSHLSATSYIEREVRRLGLVPAGDSGGFFQRLPIFSRGFDAASTVTVGDTVYRGGADFLAASSGTIIGKPIQFTNTAVIYGGLVLDTTDVLAPEQVRGKVIVLHTAPPPTGSQQAFVNSIGYRAWRTMLSGAIAVMTIDGDQIPVPALRSATTPSGIIWRSETVTTVSFGITTRMAEGIFGQSFATLKKGALGRITSSDIRFADVARPGRNVLAMIPGADPKLKGEYVVVGAPSDHLSPLGAREHDSLRIFNRVMRPQGAVSPFVQPSDSQWKVIFAAVDSVRKLRPARIDSIYNGADDGGSGAMAALELAESIVKAGTRPKRSILFVWHGGEESGLRGSRYFTDHPTVPIDSIVAEINLNALARGETADLTGVLQSGAPVHGGDLYAQAIGSYRQSTEFGDLVVAANAGLKVPMRLDFSFDAPNSPQAPFCRSDQAEYARLGIPTVFITTGTNHDFHQVSDEPQYVRYEHFAEVTRLAEAITLRVAGAEHRPVSDKPRPDPAAPCRQ